MVLTAKTNKGSVIKLKEKEYFPIEESEQDVYNKLSVAVNSNSDDLYIIKAQTGIGKTHAYIDIIKKKQQKICCRCTN